MFDARLSRLFTTLDATDRADVSSGQLPRLHYLHPQLLVTFTNE